MPLGRAHKICVRYRPHRRYSRKDRGNVRRIAADVLGIDVDRVKIERYVRYRDFGDARLVVDGVFRFDSRHLDFVPPNILREALDKAPLVRERLLEMGAKPIGPVGTLNISKSIPGDVEGPNDLEYEFRYSLVEFEYRGAKYSLDFSPDLRCVGVSGSGPPGGFLKELGWDR